MRHASLLDFSAVWEIIPIPGRAVGPAGTNQTQRKGEKALNNRKTIAVAVTAALGLVACGGGGGSAGDPGTGTTSGTRTTGVVTGFGSVYVMGIEYDTSNASYVLDGKRGNDDHDLAVGMVVTVTGKVDAGGKTGVATAIDFNDELEGEVTGNDLATGGVLTVMGQSVTVTSTTRFESAVAGQLTPTDIVAGNIVEVSGHSDGNGNIVATRIEVKAADMGSYGEDALEVKGVVRNLDSNGKTFTIGTLTVDYSGATYADMPALESDWEGLFVEVKTGQGLVGGVMQATEVEPEGDGELDFEGDDGDEFKAQGVITSVSSVTEFTLNGRAVRVTGDDENDDFTGVTASDVGRYAKVEGRLDANGTLLAEEVEFEEDGEYSLSGYVEGEPSGGTMVLLGQTVRVTSTTLLEDDRDEGGSAPEFYFDLTDIHHGDRVEVEAYRDQATGELVAVSLKRDDDHSEAQELEGTVDAVGAGSFVVAGVTVNWGGTLPPVGTEVEVRGDYASGSFSASSVSVD